MCSPFSGKSLANRHFDLTALERGLWGRLKGVQSNAPTPLINTVSRNGNATLEKKIHMACCYKSFFFSFFSF